ncbi:MAG: HXXEE domain-containing protein [Chloroflexota bacterium]
MKSAALPVTMAWLYLALVFAQALHSLEEICTGLWRQLSIVTAAMHARNAAIPVKQTNEREFTAANLLIVLAMAALLPFRFCRHPWAMNVAAGVAAVEVINGSLHVAEAVAAGGYFPGVLSGTLVLLCAGAYLVDACRKRR